MGIGVKRLHTIENTQRLRISNSALHDYAAN